MNPTLDPILNGRLQSEHRDELLIDSGLSAQTVLDAGISSVDRKKLHIELGFPVKHLSSAYRIPYFPASDFCRYRCFYILKNEKNREYVQKRNSSNRLYVPFLARKFLVDVQTPLYIVDEERKALKACQEGLPCIATPGAWGWKKGSQLIEDFNLITLDGRTIYIVPDSDWQSPECNDGNKLFIFAVEGLAKKLKEKGAKVFIKQLPPRKETTNG